MPRTKKISADKKRKQLKEKRKEELARLILEKKEKYKKENADKRQNPIYSKKENEQRAIKRLDPLLYSVEKQKIVETRKNNYSQNQEVYETSKQTNNDRNAVNRLDPEFVQQENDMAKKRMANKRKMDSLGLPCKKLKPITAIDTFREAIREGPDLVCACCKRLWFLTSCQRIDRQKLEQKFGVEYADAVYLNGASELFCNSCEKSIRKKEMPTFCANNYKIIFPIPDELKNLSIMEERMTSLRLPFMRISSGAMRQCSITGQIVNVPMNVDSTLRILPRNIEETCTIQIKLKRKMEYKHSYIHETVRPGVIRKAFDYLKEQPLYREYNVVEAINWEGNIQNYIDSQTANIDIAEDIKISNDELKAISEMVDFEEFGLDDLLLKDCDVEKKVHTAGKDIVKNDETGISNSLNNMSLKDMQPLPAVIPDNKVAEVDVFADENLIDDTEPINPGGQETLLDKDALQNICLAPGEGRTPIHLMMDLHSEEMSFPTLFCGQKKEFPENFGYGKQTKVQAQAVDRRFARTDFVLYMAKKLQLIYVVKAVLTALRKRLDGTENYTVGDVLNPIKLEELIKSDAGYMFLKGITNSPAYWKNQERKLLAMVRQYNIPTIFLTISAAESRWPELLVILVRLIDGREINEVEALNLPYGETVRLIRKDPVTTARYFDHRFRLLFKHLKSEDGPFKQNPIEHYYYRIEFQHRGSPHVHCLLWLTGAPRYSKDVPNSGKICAEFANQYITCDSKLQSIQDVISYNVHKHSKSCRREVRGKYICRYGIPYLPMDITTILEPLECDDKDILAEMKAKYTKFTELLNKKLPISFDEFLLQLNLKKENYLLIIQHNIRKPTMFIKRAPDDCFVNHFNEEIFSMQKANMDIQFILDPYACCKYIVSYINKSDRGVSDIMRAAMDEIKKGNFSLKEKLKKIGWAFLNASEISAQEAAYHVMGLRFHETCTGYIYINSKPMNKRVRMLKNAKQLRLMSATDTDIYVSGTIEHYIERADELNDICLAEFAAHYVFRSKSSKSPNEFPLKDGSGFVFRKTHSNIIAYTRYGLKEDPINFYREQLMLYVPWRNELSEIENVDHPIIYSAQIELIKLNRAKYDVLDSKILDDALALAEVREEEIGERLLNSLDEEFIPYAIDDPAFDPFSILDQPDAGTVKYTYPTPFQIPDQEYDAIIASLNLKQYEYLNHILDCMHRGEKIYNVIGGSAGVGKSRLIQAIYQSLLRYYNSLPGNNPDTVKVLLTAPTGKAAFAIEGVTLHSAFVLPVNHGYEPQLVPISSDSENTILTRLCDLKLVIIDEYSMVGSRMLDNINQRLQQLFKTRASFGGISILLLGDLRQLPPVGDRWIFDASKANPYHEICGTFLWDLFSFFELTEIMRQRNDKAFASALNNMASGAMTPEDVRLIKGRCVSDNDPLPENIIHLFRSNLEVNEFNDRKLATLDTEYTISVAKDVVKGSCSERLNQQFLREAKNLKKADTFGLMLELRLQISAKYMVSLNHDTSDGIVNGATGTLMKLEYNADRTAKRCWLQFFDSRSGKASRQKHSGYMLNNAIPATWTPIEPVARALIIRKGSNVMVERAQFPLLVSEGLTIHKSQGATYQQVAVHLKKGIPRNAIYVACSRATNLEGLFIFGDFTPPRKPTEKDKAFCELQNLRANRNLSSTYSLQYFESAKKQTIIYQNVQSFNKHFELIKNNPLFISADILIFVETWLKAGDLIDFENFDCIFALCNPNAGANRKPYGISCYTRKNNVNLCTNVRKYCKIVSFLTFQAIIFTCDKITIIALYIPPKMAIGDALTCLKEIVVYDVPTIIVGDFNQDLSHRQTNCLKQFLISKKFTSQLDTNQTTTNANTHIDWVFSNTNRIKTHIFPTVYSHHRAITMNIYDSPVTDARFLTDQMQVDTSNHLNKLHIRLDDSESDSGESYVSDDEAQIVNVAPTTTAVNNALHFGLTNADGVSCYANASIQCLLTIVEFQRCVANFSRPPISEQDNLKHSLHNIAIRTSITNCLLVRILVGPEYAIREEHDAHLFLIDLLNRLGDDSLLRHIRFSFIPNLKHCATCGYENLGNGMESLSYTLYFPENPPQTMNFGSMFDSRPTDEQCGRCHDNLTSRSKLVTVTNYLVICLMRIHMVNGNSIKIQTTFNQFNEDLITIDSIRFRCKAVIVHISNNPNDTTKGGHYIARVRCGDVWLECNDSVVRATAFDKTLRNVTVMILERIG